MVSKAQIVPIMIFVAIMLIHLVNISPITWLAIINFNITHFSRKTRISSLKYNTVFFLIVHILELIWTAAILEIQTVIQINPVWPAAADSYHGNEALLWLDREKSSKLSGSSLPRRERKQNQALLVTGAVQYLKYYHCYRQIEFTKLFFTHLYEKSNKIVCLKITLLQF